MAYVATKGIPLATTVTGSLPRPSWFTTNLNGRAFLAAMASDPVYREQYSDAVAALIGDQMRAGLDVLSDGEMRFDQDIGGRSWSGYITDRVVGIETQPAGGGEPREGIFGEVIRRQVESVGPFDASALQYDAVWKTAQRLSPKPIKVGSASAQHLDLQLQNRYFPDRRSSLTALAQALNAQYHRLADAGCAAIQIEEPTLHNASGRKRELSPNEYVDAFNVEVAGLRGKTEVWCHICWGNPFAQRLAESPLLKPMLGYIDRLDADVITFETAENGLAEIAEIAAAISKDKKICIGAVRHRSLQVETPAEVAELVRTALKYIEPERLIVSSDCGFGRQGMSRVHALYKMVALVNGTNLVRHELGLPEAPVAAADAHYALT